MEVLDSEMSRLQDVMRDTVWQLEHGCSAGALAILRAELKIYGNVTDNQRYEIRGSNVR